MLPAILFDRDLTQWFIGDKPGSTVDTLATATQEVLHVQAEEDIETATRNADQVWYIIYEPSIAEYKAAGYRTYPDLEYLDSNYHLQWIESWNELQVFFYTQAP